MLNYTCILRISPTLSWCMVLSMYCVIQFVGIWLRIFATMFIKDINLWSSIPAVSLPGFGIRVM